MRGIDVHRVVIIAGLTSLMIVYAVLWARMLASHEERTGSDFISAYTAGIVAQVWGGEQVYNLARQQAVQEEVVGFALAPGQVLMFNHPPFLVPLLAVLMSSNYVASLVRYALTMVALYVGMLAIAWHLLLRDGWERNARWIALTGMATFYPLFVSLLNTQDTALMMLGAFLWFWGLVSDRPRLAGLGLALTAVRPHVTLVLAAPFLFRRREVLVWFAVGGAVLGILSLIAVGVEGLKLYVHILLTAAGGEFYGMQEAAMVNLVGLLWRLAPGLGGGAIRMIGWVFYGLTIVFLCVLWRRSLQVGEKQMAWAVLLAVLSVPHLHYHDLTLLVLPILVLMRQVSCFAGIERRRIALMPLVASYVLLFGSLVQGWRYDIPYCLMLALGLALTRSEKVLRPMADD
ncbi:MAG: DUF2029 domain-containing protein [Anaerolineales bacterium]|nr:DUF2029 domain-containing protein [Anaerolineales bacterium]